jgi:anti-sigma B factor antagonist
VTGTQVQPAPRRGRLTIQRREEADGVTLSIRGEVDLASATALKRELDDSEHTQLRRIILDLAAMDFIDSSGIRVLLHAKERADRNGHSLVLTNVPADAQRLFRLTGLDTHLAIQ